jgi:hypothetical protein
VLYATADLEGMARFPLARQRPDCQIFIGVPEDLKPRSLGTPKN